jgi:hypothetical protein
MPLFGWVQALQVGWQLGQVLRGEIEAIDEEVGGEASGVTLSRDQRELARLLAFRVVREESQAAKIERTRWLEEHDAERSFPCGIVPDPVLEATQPEPPETRPRPLLPSEPGWASPEDPVTDAVPPDPQPLTPLRPMQVIAAVLREDLVFIREQGEDEEVEEVGRLPRTAIQDVDVVDLEGTHVPEPVEETIEPSRLVFTVLRWSNVGRPDEDRFAFRSAWMAWQAARHLRAAKR